MNKKLILVVTSAMLIGVGLKANDQTEGLKLNENVQYADLFADIAAGKTGEIVGVLLEALSSTISGAATSAQTQGLKNLFVDTCNGLGKKIAAELTCDNMVLAVKAASGQPTFKNACSTALKSAIGTLDPTMASILCLNADVMVKPICKLGEIELQRLINSNLASVCSNLAIK